MSRILASLGLTADEVRRLTGTTKPKKPAELPEPKKYLYAGDQRRIRRRLRDYHGFIISRYLEGYGPNMIAALLCVSEESVRSRLRKNGCFGEGGPGRPKASARKLPTRLCISPTSPLTR